MIKFNEIKIGERLLVVGMLPVGGVNYSNRRASAQIERGTVVVVKSVSDEYVEIQTPNGDRVTFHHSGAIHLEKMTPDQITIHEQIGIIRRLELALDSLEFERDNLEFERGRMVEQNLAVCQRESNLRKKVFLLIGQLRKGRPLKKKSRKG